MYTVAESNVAGEPDQLTVPEYWELLVIEVTGTAPCTGGVTPAIAA